MRPRRLMPSVEPTGMRRATGLLGLALVTMLGGCRLPEADGPAVPHDSNAPPLGPVVHQSRFAPGTLIPLSGPGRTEYPLELRTDSVVRPSARGQMPEDDSVVIVGGVSVPVPTTGPPSTLPVPEPPTKPAKATTSPVSTAEPPIRLPDAPTAPAPSPSSLPPLPVIPDAGIGSPPPIGSPVVVPSPSFAGPIEVGGHPITYDSLTRMLDGSDFGAFGGPGSCSVCEGGACGPGQCRAGAGPGHCEYFHATGPATRFVKLIYECICCPDPCYQPHWEPLADAAFFTDAPRPVTQTRVRWDYGAHLIYPDRGEFFWARADGNGKGPRSNPPALGTAYLDYHELSLQAEAAAGPASVTIVTPYRSVNPFPFANSAAGFGDVTITAKNILYDCELFLFSFQMRTYIPSGNFGKGLGVGHMSLEPGLIAGLRVGPNTYAVAQVAEWIPLGGEQDYQGAHLRFNFSLNHILWRPVKDVQLIGTFELNGINWQDGAFTDAVAGPLQKLSGQTAIGLGCGMRLFFCDRFDFGAGGMFGTTGKYWAREQMRFEVRYRF